MEEGEERCRVVERERREEWRVGGGVREEWKGRGRGGGISSKIPYSKRAGDVQGRWGGRGWRTARREEAKSDVK